VPDEPDCRLEGEFVLAKSSLGVAVAHPSPPTYSSDDGIDSNAVTSIRKRSSSGGIGGNELRSRESHKESCWSSGKQASFFLWLILAACKEIHASATNPYTESSAVLLSTSQNAEFSEHDDGSQCGGSI